MNKLQKRQFLQFAKRCYLHFALLYCHSVFVCLTNQKKTQRQTDVNICQTINDNSDDHSSVKFAQRTSAHQSGCVWQRSTCRINTHVKNMWSWFMQQLFDTREFDTSLFESWVWRVSSSKYVKKLSLLLSKYFIQLLFYSSDLNTKWPTQSACIVSWLILNSAEIVL